MFIDLHVLGFFITLIVTLLVIWFKTDAFVEYMELFGFKKLFYIKEYKDWQMSGTATYAVGYPDFLLVTHNCFLTRLMSCPTCSAFWLSLLSCAKTGLVFLPLVFLVSLVSFHLVERVISYERQS